MDSWLFVICFTAFCGCFSISLALWSLADAVRGLRGQGHDVAMELIPQKLYYNQLLKDRREGTGEFGWSMMCVDCGADMPISKIHAKMAFDLMMRTKGKPQPRCPKCAESFVWVKEAK